MPKVTYTFSLDHEGISETKYILTETVDSTTLHTLDNSSTCDSDHGHTHDNGGVGYDYKPVVLKLHYDYVSTSGCVTGSNRIRMQIVVKNHGTGVTLAYTPFDWVSADEDHTLKLAFLPGGLPNGQPTYLETLDKMDQWSKAQYVPHTRTALMD